MIDQVIQEYVKVAIAVANDATLNLQVKSDAMGKVASALGTLVPLMNTGADQQLTAEKQQQDMEMALQKHQADMQMAQDRHQQDLAMKQQQHALALEMQKQKAAQAYKQQQTNNKPQKP
jgi:7-keto-8-aminopelargonate synthetase-like enzyme